MKGKFRILGRSVLGAFLVCALMLAVIPALPVAAEGATAVTEVWVDFPFTDTPPNETDESLQNIYIIHFTPTTALSRGVDTVTVTFPDGSATMSGTAGTAYDFDVTDADMADVAFSTNYGTPDATAAWYTLTADGTVGGYRVKVTTPIDVAAGSDVWVRFTCDDADTNITSATTAGVNYKVYVGTSQDTTPVLSSAFALDDAADEVGSFAIAPLVDTAGVSTQYIATFTPASGSDLEAGDKVTIKFPLGTTMPSSLSITDVKFAVGSGDYSNSTAATFDADLRTITGTIPVAIAHGDTNSKMKIESDAGVANPQTAATCYWMMNTAKDGLWSYDGAAITAGAATQIIVAEGAIGLATPRYSDDATMINMYSSQIYVTMADRYGNAVAVSSPGVEIGLAASPSGNFYWHDTKDSALVMTACETITAIVADPVAGDDEAGAGDQIVYFKDSTAGSHTLTFSNASYTNATWVIDLAPAVSLIDSNDNVVNTYGPTTSATAAELNITDVTGVSEPYFGVDYINNAITAAFPGDTVKLGDGIYELDTYIDLDKKITLTSVNGAASTTLRNTAATLADAILLGTTGTSTNPVVIDGFTIQRLRDGQEIRNAVQNQDCDYLTVQNCTFRNIYPNEQADSGNGAVVACWAQASSLTSATVSNNTFISCGLDPDSWPSLVAGQSWNAPAVINFKAHPTPGSVKLTGGTISGNTLTDCAGYGIVVKGSTTTGQDAYYATASISDNTLTNCVHAIDIDGFTRNVSITGNTITGAYTYAILGEGQRCSSLTIKNNTVTGCCNSANGAVRINHQPDDPTATTDYAGTPSSYTHYVQYNDIYDNNGPALEVDSQTTDATITASLINCQYNYFGDASGPYYSALSGATVAKSNPNGTGDKVTDRVFYYPWLYKSRADVVNANVSYQTSTMKLVLGWNTLSTPVQLIDTANSIDELISTDDMEIGYYYDATATVPGWQQIITGKVLSPCDAVYVKMLSAKYVQFKFDAGAWTMPSKDLAVGWNLIGLAYLSSAGMDADEAVASVYKTAANLPGYSQVIGPSVIDVQTDLYGSTTCASFAYSSGETSADANMMYAGLGYWVYMQNAATLAGFTITPIAPDLD